MAQRHHSARREPPAVALKPAVPRRVLFAGTVRRVRVWFPGATRDTEPHWTLRCVCTWKRQKGEARMSTLKGPSNDHALLVVAPTSTICPMRKGKVYVSGCYDSLLGPRMPDSAMKTRVLRDIKRGGSGAAFELASQRAQRTETGIQRTSHWSCNDQSGDRLYLGSREQGPSLYDREIEGYGRLCLHPRRSPGWLLLENLNLLNERCLTAYAEEERPCLPLLECELRGHRSHGESTNLARQSLTLISWMWRR